MQPKSDLPSMIYDYYRAYETKERDAIERLLASDFKFSSPLDDHIDRATYFSRCWPNCERIRSFRIRRLLVRDGEAFVQYELIPTVGDGFSNAELFLSDGKQICEINVFFGNRNGTVGDNG